MTSMPPAYDRVDFADRADSARVVVEWLMSSICNYTCSYCPAALHDGRVRYPDWTTVSSFVERVCDHYRDSELTFLLTGGEITTYRQLVPLMTLLRARGCSIAVLSNGSKAVRWWRERASTVDEVMLSYHHERADDDHLLAVAEVLTPSASVQFNVVIDPSNFDQTVAFGIRAMAESAAAVNFKIMFEDGWRRPATYDPGQQTVLTDAIARSSEHNAKQRPTVLKGDMVLSGPGQAARRLSALQIIDNGLNSWQGWACDVGLTTLFIRFDEIWRASCRVGGVLGSIYDQQLRLPREPVVCSRQSCNCIAGIKSHKDAMPSGAVGGLLPILTS